MLNTMRGILTLSRMGGKITEIISKELSALKQGVRTVWDGTEKGKLVFVKFRPVKPAGVRRPIVYVAGWKARKPKGEITSRKAPGNPPPVTEIPKGYRPTSPPRFAREPKTYTNQGRRCVQWSFSEWEETERLLQKGLSAGATADILNRDFHGGNSVRTVASVRGKTQAMSGRKVVKPFG